MPSVRLFIESWSQTIVIDFTDPVFPALFRLNEDVALVPLWNPDTATTINDMIALYRQQVGASQVSAAFKTQTEIEVLIEKAMSEARANLNDEILNVMDSAASVLTRLVSDARSNVCSLECVLMHQLHPNPLPWEDQT